MIFKKLKFFKLVIFILSCCVVTAGSSFEGNTDFPFEPGEKSAYKIKWGYIPAGEAVFEVKSIDEVNNTPCLSFLNDRADKSIH